MGGMTATASSTGDTREPAVLDGNTDLVQCRIDEMVPSAQIDANLNDRHTASPSGTGDVAETTNPATNPKITSGSLDLFLGYAADAGNWSGTPPLGGGGGGTKEARGNITQLKRAGLIETFIDEGGDGGDETWVRFTTDGRALAALHGIEIS
ncbi:hypothetical protein BKG82_13150 [Mycobacteroides chelonae]|uniref:Uncharacterized protein n=2 Tax=Mycobacteroides chelonae TaxID=1774 RepID=A0A1S1LTX6_MYCCH|nr:hypothetical protein BKG82_13150 [Mycobacteroides chelonae]